MKGFVVVLSVLGFVHEFGKIFTCANSLGITGLYGAAASLLTALTPPDTFWPMLIPRARRRAVLHGTTAALYARLTSYSLPPPPPPTVALPPPTTTPLPTTLTPFLNAALALRELLYLKKEKTLKTNNLAKFGRLFSDKTYQP